MSTTSPPSLQIHLHVLCFLFLMITLPFHGDSQTNDPELRILLKLKQHWSSSPSINHWTPSSNSTSTHCTWPEITCTNGFVTGLKLIDMNVAETIPSFICDLQNLTLIDLHGNDIPGPFPTVLYNCFKLEHLDLSQNHFIGLIPDDIDRLSPRLQYLNLDYNNFTGDIPATIGRFAQLTTLSLFENLFNGSFPSEIGNLSKLEVLGMPYNSFAPSTIPPSFARLKKLRQLWMAETNLIGEIPESIGNLTALECLDFSQNRLTGNIPSGLFLLKNLTILYLWINRLTGSIPQSIEALNLNVIDLSENNLTGTIPGDFEKLTNLTGLALNVNKLSGHVPEGIGRLPKLVDFALFSNNLSGELPPDCGRYSMLRTFQVSSNAFTGKLPEYLCANGTLRGVVAFDNNLTGELPKSLGNCPTLRTFQVHGNRFSGKVPDGLWTTYNLSTLFLSGNSFTGELPDKLGMNLSIIDISNNQFSGEIPVGISSWKSLREFRASNNHFSGTIPQELTTLPLLTTLLLDDNLLSGHLPQNMTSWGSLSTLNLSRNQLSGEIPAEFGFLPVLIDLDLSENELSGQIPHELGRLKLISFNLSSNRLTGRIPDEFENAVFDSSFLNNPGLCAEEYSSLPACSSRPGKSSTLSSQYIAIVTSVVVGVCVLALLFAFYVIRSYRKKKDEPDSTWKLTPFQSLNFTESIILSNLTENYVIGRGGSGEVYRVAINPSGRYVAVKRIWQTGKLDQRLEQEFLAEVRILGTIQHSNIVKLLCCISSESSKLLVYEFLENGSLDRWLHGKRRRPSMVTGSVHHVVLDWPKRLKIAVGAARGLCYMHHDCSPPIIHRDVKSSNILLDTEFNAKIADFGLARMLVRDGEPKTMSAVAGSFGYIAPEYAYTRRVNEKIDVYSFGVILLELVTGREANNGDDDTSLAEWAWRYMQEDNPIVDALDEDIKEPCYLAEMSSIFRLGFFCTDPRPSNRPSMKEVQQILLQCNDALAFKVRNIGSEYDATPLLRNSRRQRTLENEDGDLLSIV